MGQSNGHPDSPLARCCHPCETISYLIDYKRTWHVGNIEWFHFSVLLHEFISGNLTLQCLRTWFIYLTIVMARVSNLQWGAARSSHPSYTGYLYGLYRLWIAGRPLATATLEDGFANNELSKEINSLQQTLLISVYLTQFWWYFLEFSWNCSSTQ